MWKKPQRAAASCTAAASPDRSSRRTPFNRTARRYCMGLVPSTSWKQ
jgi:hypothetical protein